MYGIFTRACYPLQDLLHIVLFGGNLNLSICIDMILIVYVEKYTAYS